MTFNQLKKIQIAILGSGRMGQRHAETYKKISRHVEIKGFYDIETKLADRLASRYHAKTYDSADSAIEDPEVDAISVCTPNALHYEILKNAIKHQKNVLVEKPIVTTVEHCRSVMSMMNKSSIKIMVGHTHRFYPCNLALKSVLYSGKIGRPRIINTFDFIPGKNPGQKMPRWMKVRKISGGGVFMTDLIHTVDKISWLLNSPITKVFTPMMSNFIEQRDVEDAGIAILWLKNGAIATCTHGCPSPGAADMSIRVMGTSGEASLEFGKKLTLHKNIASNVKYKYQGNLLKHNSQAFSDEINGFVNSILYDRQPTVTYRDGVGAVRVILALYESFRQNRPVSIP